MNCLDTYALIEIASGNSIFTPFLQQDFVITHETLAEFYWVLLRDTSVETAQSWIQKLQAYSQAVPLSLLLQSVHFRSRHKRQNLSYFDCVGYIYSLENHFSFVTGDKEFKSLPGVTFVQ